MRSFPTVNKAAYILSATASLCIIIAFAPLSICKSGPAVEVLLDGQREKTRCRHHIVYQRQRAQAMVTRRSDPYALQSLDSAYVFLYSSQLRQDAQSQSQPFAKVPVNPSWQCLLPLRDSDEEYVTERTSIPMHIDFFEIPVIYHEVLARIQTLHNLSAVS